MKAIIISIGDELISGDITNTNSSFIASELYHNDIELEQIITIGDDFEGLVRCFDNIPKDVDKVFVSGGLGPTHDDITKKVAVHYFDSELVFHQDLLDAMIARFSHRNIPMTESNRSQAYLPKDCKQILNNHGTATGMEFTKNGKDFYFMPGVPHEMKAMITEQILPKLLSDKSKKMQVKVIRTYGLGESSLYESMKDWMAKNPDVKVAFYPKYEGNDIKLQFYPKDKNAIDEMILQLGDIVYGFDQETIEQKIAEKLIAKNLTIAVAESCTGGLISSRLTDISGSSQYMMQGMITYSNEAKMKLLGVKTETLEKYGAVSQETALEMAEGVRRNSGCDIGISTTGIAGPTGGTEEKPLGTLWAAVSIGDKTEAFHFCRNINRQANKIIFSQFILKKLLEKLY